jgi:VanZ like family
MPRTVPREAGGLGPSGEKKIVERLLSILALWQFAWLRWSALAVLFAVYAFVSLEPFDWYLPTRLVNGATQIADGWAFPTPGIVLAASSPLPWLASAREAEALELSLEVRPGASQRGGRIHSQDIYTILTISKNLDNSNLTIAQEGDDLVLRLRSEDTDSKGRRDGRPVARLKNVLFAGKWVAIDLGIRPGRLTIAVDGHQELEAPLPPSVLATWNPDYDLALGNEVTCNRPWLGEIRNPVITVPDGSTDYGEAHQVDRPGVCSSPPPKLVPLVKLDPVDAALNFPMYLPLGCLLGLMVLRRSWGNFVALVLVVVSVSLTFELAQLFLASRAPSVDDVIFNTLGGALGIWLGFRLAKQAAPWRPQR